MNTLHLGIGLALFLIMSSCGQQTTVNQNVSSSQNVSSNELKADTTHLKTIKPEVSFTPDFSPEQEKNFQRWSFLSNKPQLTPKEEQELQDLESKVDNPTKDDFWDIFGGGDYNIEPVKTSIKAVSSTLKAEKNVSYNAQNVLDNKGNTSWLEGAKGQGIGESISLLVKKEDAIWAKGTESEKNIDMIDIFNGYIKNSSTFKNNSRVKKLKLYVNNQALAILELNDLPSRQSFDLSELELPKDTDLVFTFEILDVYKGDKYEDTAITELYIGHSAM